MKRGLFITFEGGEGSGKSTQVRVLTRVLEDHGYEVVALREPGGTPVGEAIRSVLLSSENDAMTPVAELLLYEAARAQVVEELIKPALAAGKIVLCDRFYDSTVAYQGYGRGIENATIHTLNDYAVQGCHPDRTVLIDLDPSLGLRRAAEVSEADRLEKAGDDFHERVRQGFLNLAGTCPERIRVVEQRPERLETALAIFLELADLFEDISPRAVAVSFQNDPQAFLGGESK